MQYKGFLSIYKIRMEISMVKNHILINGQLLQTNKKFADLKLTQKEKINEWLYESYKNYYGYKKSYPGNGEDEQIVECVLDKITSCNIWIPEKEIYAYYQKKKNALRKRLEKELPITEKAEG